MNRRPAVHLVAPTSPVLRSAVLDLTPRDDEVVFAGRASVTLPAAEADPTRFPVAILDGASVPVGFLVLDQGARSGRYAGPGVIGVHGFFIDHRHRQRGLARAALLALPAYVAEHHAETTAIALTVATTNAPAIAAYLAGGFRDTGEIFVAEENGTRQHVMRSDVTN